MATLIFKSLEEFLKRGNKDDNGVSEQFALENQNFEADNESNRGSWNCINCVDCKFCALCAQCLDCKVCIDCLNCTQCSNMFSSTGCDLCVGGVGKVNEFSSNFTYDEVTTS